MTTPDDTLSLEQRISNTESRLAARRAHLGVAVGGIGDTIRRQTVSPESLATGVLFGVALERSRNFWDWRLLTILGAGRAGIRLLHGLASGPVSSATVPDAGDQVAASTGQTHIPATARIRE